MARKGKDSVAIAAEIERLKAALVDAEAAERAKKLDDLARLLSSKQALDEALDWAREKFGRDRRTTA